MAQPESISKEKLEQAFEHMRKDVAYLQRDLAYAEGNRARWLFIIMWLVLGHFVKDIFALHAAYSLAISAVLVAGYRVVDGLRITRHAYRSTKEPLEPMWDTKVDLS